jgi:hypothetical protein
MVARVFGVVLSVSALSDCSSVYHGRGTSYARLTSRHAPTRVALRRWHGRPTSALLAPLPEPDCQFRGTVSPAPGQAEPDKAEVQRVKLDYERQCYRQADMIARERLRQLQTSVGGR